MDELNSTIGVVRAFNIESVGNHPAADRLEAELRWMQNKLFDVSGLLPRLQANAQEYANGRSSDVTRLETLMDRCQKGLPPLKECILPGGGKISRLLHQAKTICRRAERLCVRLGREEPLDPALVRFLNRLSDALFVLARWMAKQQSEPEFLWERDTKGT